MATYGDLIWTSWTTATTSITCPDPWYLWTTNTSTTASGVDWRWLKWAEKDEARVQAQLRAQQRRQQERAWAEPRVIEDPAAKQKAEKILLRHLSDLQKKQRAELGFFDITTPSGRIYRIHEGTHGNVREMVKLPDGTLRAVASLCCQPEGVPVADAHLAQLLWLMRSEEAFRRTAIIRQYDPRAHMAPARGDLALA